MKLDCQLSANQQRKTEGTDGEVLGRIGVVARLHGNSLAAGGKSHTPLLPGCRNQHNRRRSGGLSRAISVVMVLVRLEGFGETTAVLASGLGI